MRFSSSAALNAARSVTALLLLIPMTTSCAGVTALLKPELLNREAPAELKTPCPRVPALPAAFLTAEDRLAWTAKALTAGDECRAKSDAQGEWIATPPK